MARKFCAGCEMRIEIACMFGGFDDNGNCKGCAQAEKDAGREERYAAAYTPQEWSPEIAEAMRLR